MIIDTQLEEVRKYILKNFNKMSSVKDIAEAFHFNYSSLRMSFVKKYGISLNAYLNQIKCRKAKVYLRHTDWKILKIANEVGYNDEEYFIKVFKKHYHISPGKYRN
jgi:two-component system response regulator YesN